MDALTLALFCVMCGTIVLSALVCLVCNAEMKEKNKEIASLRRRLALGRAEFIPPGFEPTIVMSDLWRLVKKRLGFKYDGEWQPYSAHILFRLFKDAKTTIHRLDKEQMEWLRSVVSCMASVIVEEREAMMTKEDYDIDFDSEGGFNITPRR